MGRTNQSLPSKTEEKGPKQTKETKSPEAVPKREVEERAEHFSNFDVYTNHLGILWNCRC